MATTVALHNTSWSNGGACTCNDAHVQGPAGKTGTHTIQSEQTAIWDLSALGWDSYEGQEFEVAAICSGSSNWRHSTKFVYKLNANYQFDWEGPSGNPKIVGPK
jgi:hypothetical protein